MPTGEWALRPLTRLLKDHPDAIEPVWKDAVAEVGGAVPDAGEVKSAISRWRAANGSGAPARDCYGKSARERRQQIVAEATFLAETGHLDELSVALTAIQQLVATNSGSS